MSTGTTDTDGPNEGRKPKGKFEAKRDAMRAKLSQVLKPNPDTFIVDDKIDEEDPWIQDLTTLPIHLFDGKRKYQAVFVNKNTNERVVRWVTQPVGEPKAVSSRKRAPVALSLSSTVDESLQLPPGVTVVFAATGVGKSSFVRALAKRSKRIVLMTVVEPFDDSSEIAESIAFDYIDDAIGHGLRLWSADRSVIPVIDSLRSPLFEMTGPAADKGIINTFFTTLTRVSNGLASQGCTMIMTLNPMSDKPEQQALVETYLRASVPAVIRLNESQANVYRGTYTVRSFGDKYRRPIDFTALMTPREKPEVAVALTLPEIPPVAAPESDDLLLHAAEEIATRIPTHVNRASRNGGDTSTRNETSFN